MDTLEQLFAKWLGVRLAVAAGFGRSAIYLAVKAALPDAGDVLVPEFICAEVPEAVRRAGARPVAYPVQRDLSISADDLHRARTPDTRAVIAVHYFGRALRNISELFEFCRSRKLLLIEDCALAFGARQDGRLVGSFGDLAVFSFTKGDWCYGGGMVATNTPELARKLRDLQQHELRPRPGLLWRYGLLRRVDFAANRPSWSRAAERCGRVIQGLVFAGEDDFYSRGEFDAAISDSAARRAIRILSNHARDLKAKRSILHQIRETVRSSSEILFRPEEDEGDSAAFILLRAPEDAARDCVQRANARSLTLRRAWPAYQEISVWSVSASVPWLAARLLILELHPGLTGKEIRHIGETLSEWATKT